MKKLTVDIRKIFVDFFIKKKHKLIEGSSLISNDKSLLFTNAGMNQFKNIFLEKEKCNYKRIVTVQNCLRTGGKHNDFENIGVTNKHHTFFEMLGNFSFGDYFKKKAILYAWELLTNKNWFNIPTKQLYVTVHEKDKETYDIWRKNTSINLKNIFLTKNDKKNKNISDNFWQMSDTGPCGYSTEIFYDMDYNISYKNINNKISNNFLEIWNIVFIQFNRLINGNIIPLKKMYVDTGMGLERISTVLQRKKTTYEIDIFKKLNFYISKMLEIPIKNNNCALNIISDHIRSATFLISENILPSNEGRGYILRRIIRRASINGYKLGIKNIFLFRIIPFLISSLDKYHKYVINKEKYIIKVIKKEEEKFHLTLNKGFKILKKNISKLKKNVLNGKKAFFLYDTYGFPIYLIEDICKTKNIKIDKKSFNKEMKKQKKRSRKNNKKNIFLNDIIYNIKNNKMFSVFEGYDKNHITSKIISIIYKNNNINKTIANKENVIILDKTTFYGESGGQIGDTGFIKSSTGKFEVTNTIHNNNCIYHIGKIKQGFLTIYQTVDAKINSSRRLLIQKNHSATHLLHSSLRKILGKNIIQKGSLVNENYLRFDFSYDKKIDINYIHSIENLVNYKIFKNIKIKTKTTDIKKIDTKKTLSLFKNKYKSKVRVVYINDFSQELCIGTHVKNTGEIGLFKIIKEYNISSGIRRIEAITEKRTLSYINNQNLLINNISNILKTNVDNIYNNIKKNIEENISLKKRIKLLTNKENYLLSKQLIKKSIKIKHINLIVSIIKNITKKSMQDTINIIKKYFKYTIVILVTIYDKKAFLTSSVTKNITKNFDASKIIKNITNEINGNGGGNKQIAHGSGKNVQILNFALSKTKKKIINKINNL
ncbi:alanine--tRNA ligase [Buchnera aphidicola (Taiwanaphis decaspermi)]|uniref:alanine--tRNA ligase n=1 Tax=Buchnera aphidicola TaxID=9 RepID=UPI0031B8696F